MSPMVINPLIMARTALFVLLLAFSLMLGILLNLYLVTWLVIYRFDKLRACKWSQLIQIHAVLLLDIILLRGGQHSRQASF